MTATASTLFESCLALADIVDLGQDHFIERQLVERAFQREHPRVPSNAVSSTSAVDSDPYANSSNDVASTSAISDLAALFGRQTILRSRGVGVKG